MPYFDKIIKKKVHAIQPQHVKAQAVTQPYGTSPNSSPAMHAESFAILPRNLRIILFFFPTPFLIFLITEGNNIAYGAAYALWIAIANFEILINARTNKFPSKIVILLAAALFFNLFIISLQERDETVQTTLLLLLKIVMFLNTIYIFDTLRRYGLRSVFGPITASATFMIILSAVNLFAYPQFHFGRHLYFGLHPNLGGEFLIGLLILIWWGGRKYIFLASTAIVLILLVLLQSRSAFLSLVFFLAVAAIWRIGPKRSIYIYITLMGAAATLIIFTPLQNFAVNLLDQFLSRVMLVNDLHRGINTGLTGRVETWRWALVLFEQKPFFGFGLDQGPRTLAGIDIHSGPLLLLVEFGAIGILLFLFVFFKSIHHAFTNKLISPAIAACWVLFLLQPRLINLNIFPMIMWLAILPWPQAKK